MSYHYPGSQPTQTQYTTQQTGGINVPQQPRQSRSRPPPAGTTVAYDYQEQSASIPYSSHQSQTGALTVPQQHRQSLSTRPHSISPHTSSRVDYVEQPSGFPSSYNGPSHTQMAYSGADDAAYDWGSLTARPVDPGFPEPHPSASGAIQRSRSGQHREPSISSSATIRRSPTAHTTTLYASTNTSSSVRRDPANTNSSVRRDPSEHSSALRAPAHSSARRSPSTHSSALYAPTNDSVHRSPAEQPATLYAPAGYSVQPRPTRLQSQQPQQAYYTSSGAQPSFEPATSYAEPSVHFAGSHGHGATVSDGRYQTGAPVTRHGIPPDPTYQPHPQERVVVAPQHRDDYEYDGLNESELVPKGPGHVPAQGRPHTCRMLGCNRPMYFDRRFNEFWEWCSVQHIHEALGRGMEKVCKSCRVWPRKNGYRCCGGDACNKRGVPL